MTRLTPDNIFGLSHDLRDYDLELHKKTGFTLKGLSLLATELSEHEFALRSKDSLFAIVPMTSGQGVISGFSEAVCDIISFLQCQAKITSSPDIAGMAEAFHAQADFIFCADDADFICLNMKTRSVVHNDQATAKGYATALKIHLDHRQGKVLVLGCGRIGQSALAELLVDKFHVAVYDPDAAKVAAWYENLSSEKKKYTQILSSFPPSFDEYAGVLDATPVPDIIYPQLVHTDLLIAAPGVPLGIPSEALDQVKAQVVHDPLQIGVAVMVTLSLKMAE
ncbi:MAG: 3-methylornithyl-N6-L-lysine dehydrogenase PylD [Desulfovermiculus sp.]|nr:3-methylornithyl-N6-L-lysine dehydrogenase PylD [Desulfovermiculus sp.]